MVNRVERFIALIGIFLLAASMLLLWSVSWKIAVGVFLFGWFLNIDSKK